MDARVVAASIAEVEGERLSAEAALAEHDEASIDEAALRAMIAAVDVGAMFDHADPADKAAAYADLGLTLTYKPSERLVVAEARPVYVARVGGPSAEESDWRIMSWDKASECLRVRAQ